MEQNRAAICMVEKEIRAICNFYIVLAIFYEIFYIAISMVDKKEIRAIYSFYIVFIIFYKIFTIDQQLIRYRTNDRYTFIIIDIKFVLLLK
jgi:hypothetical protein